MIDLDVLERLATTAEQASRRISDGRRLLTFGEAEAAYDDAEAFQSAMKPQVALGLVAALRAAGKVAEAAQAYREAMFAEPQNLDQTVTARHRLWAALTVYDQAVSP